MPFDSIPNRLITKDDFRENTKGGSFDRRKTIKLIDDALDEWHKNINFNNTVRVYKECRHWLKAKQLKTDGNTPKRKNQINILLAGTLAWMRHLDPQFGRAFDLFEQKKATQGRHPGLQPMQGVYMHERSLYVKNNKQRAPSASMLDAQYDNLKKPSKFPQEFGDLKEKEYAEIDRLTGRTQDVIYMRKMSRLRDMLLIDNVGRFTGVDGLITNTNQKYGWPFAMDRYGNVFTLDDVSADGQFNHSSFNAGNDVVCAGFIKILNGGLLLVSNNSGHYKPRRGHLQKLLGILKADLVDLTNCVIEFHDYSTGKLHVFEYTVSAFEVSRDGPQLGNMRGVTQIC